MMQNGIMKLFPFFITAFLSAIQTETIAGRAQSKDEEIIVEDSETESAENEDEDGDGDGENDNENTDDDGDDNE